MAAALIFVPGAMPSFDRDGNTCIAELYFYTNDGTYTPKTVYTSSALTAAHPFPVVSDASGAFPTIWADSAQSFTVSWQTREADPQTKTTVNLMPATAVTAGPPGPGGPAATVAVGTVTTLPAGSPAAVTNVGSSTMAVFNFDLPQGANGAGIGTVTSINASGGTTGLSFTGGPITSNGSLTLSGTLSAANGGTGLNALGAGVAAALGQAVAGSGGLVLSNSPTLVTPSLGTPSAAVLTNATGLPLTSGVVGVLPRANGGTGLAAAGSSGNVLTSNGTDWVSSAPSSSFTLLAVLTASTSPTLDDITHITAAYDAYRIDFENVVPTTSNAKLQMAVTSNAGGAWNTMDARDGLISYLDPSVPGFVTVGTITNAGRGITGSGLFSNPNSSSSTKRIAGSAWNSTSAGAGGGIYSLGNEYTGSTAAVNGIRFFFDAGNIAAGKIRIYGVKTT